MKTDLRNIAQQTLRVFASGLSILLLLILSVCPFSSAYADDVTSDVEISQSRLRFNSRTLQSSTRVSLENIGTNTFQGPIRAFVENISRGDVAVANADGEEGGVPYFEYPEAELAPGASTSVKTWYFDCPNRASFTFDVTVTASVQSTNTAPVADAGADQSGAVGDTIALDGSGSTDADGDSLTYSWTLSVPAGSSASLDDPTSVTPSFVIDIPGEYTAELVVNDGTEDSVADAVTISTVNTAPVADAGPDQSGAVGDTIVLDGSGSSDADGDPLTYSWTLSVPAGSSASLDDPTSVTPSFVIDIPGEYTAELVVNDGTEDSVADAVTISTVNTAPVADAGPDQSGAVGDAIVLDGSGSTDVDGDPLTYSWTLSVPAGSSTSLDDPTSVTPSFVIDEPGEYTAELIVNDGTDDSAPDAVTISTVNTAPVADAGEDQTGITGDTINLDGSGSTDVDGDNLTFSWSFQSQPAGSTATLSDPTSITPSFEVDAVGDYVVQLIVNDGTVASAPDTVTINIENSPPVADAGEDQTALVGDSVMLDGSASYDIDGDTLTYLWSFVSVPADSSAELSDPLVDNPSFEVDMSGTYIVQLIVNDGLLNSAPATVIISTENSIPVADAGPNQNVLTIDTIQLDGSGSFDVDGDILTYDWSVTNTPVGATADLSASDVMDPTLNVDTEGDYLVQLIVNDGTVNSNPATTIITAADPPLLNIEGGSIIEGDIGTATLTFTVSLSEALDRVISVDYSSVDGTALAGEDYTAVSGTLTFAANDTTPQTVAVSINGDTDVESDETMSVNLSNATNAAIGTFAALGTIINDDTVPTITLTPGTMALQTGQTGELTVTISTAAGAGGQVIDLTSSNPSVVAPDSATVTISEGETSATITVTSTDTTGLSTITASASGFISDTTDVSVTNRNMTLTLDGPLVGIGRSVGGMVTLGTPAEAGGVVVNLTSSDSGLATVAPASVTIAEGNSTAAFTVDGVAEGPVTISGNADGYDTATVSLNVTGQLITIGSADPIGPDQTTELAISISSPAPTGGLTINFVSSDTNIATVDTSVTIPEGLQVPASNPVVTGVNIGTAQITATASGFAPDTRDVVVTVELTFDPSPFDLVVETIENITLDISAPAPSGGLTLNLSSDDNSVASVPSTITVPAGQTSVEVPVSGMAVGDTVVRASAAGIAEETVNVTVEPQPSITFSATPNLGNNLQQSVWGYLGEPAPAGNLEVTLSSSDPSRLLLSPDATTAGSASITVSVSAGGTNFNYYVHALDSSGTVEYTASAPGYSTGTASVNCYPSGFYIQTGNITTDSFAGNSNVQVRSCRLNPDTMAVSTYQRIRGGFSVDVDVTSSDTSVGAITTSPVTFTGNVYYLNTQFDPQSAGETIIRISTPAGFDTPSNRQAITATVSASDVYFATSSVTVGKNLQQGLGIYLESTPPGPVDVIVTCNNSGIAVISSDATAEGSGTVTFSGVTSSYVGSIYVQGMSIGDAELTVSATGFNSRGPASVAVVPSGLYFQTGNITTDAFAGNSNVQVRSGRLNPDTMAVATYQRVRGGFSVDVEVTSSDTGVGNITTSPVTIPTNTYYAQTQFDPQSAGETIISISTPAGFDTPTNRQSITATVTASDVYFATSSVTVGKNLQQGLGIYLESTPPGPVDVIVTCNNSGIAVISSDETTEGSSSFTFSGVTSSYVGTIYVQGMSIGDAELTVSATGFSSRGPASVAVVPSGFYIQTGNITTDAFAGNSNVQVRSGRLNPDTMAVATYQRVRGGLSVDVEITSSDTGVGNITTSPVTIPSNVYYATTEFDPQSAGETTISVSTPAGFDTPSNRQSITATVEVPDVYFAVSSVDVGRNLEQSVGIYLDSAPPSPVDVTITSSAGAIAIVSLDATAEGGDSVTFSGVTSTYVGTIYVQGISNGDTILTVSAAGYNDNTCNVTVVPSGFYFQTGSFTTTSGAANTYVQVRSGRLNPDTLILVNTQRLRGGLSVDVEVTSSDTSVGNITTSPVTFTGYVNYVNTQFDPQAEGQSTLSVSTPAGFDTPSNRQSITATVNP